MIDPDHFLDISNQVCPMTMVRTRLLIDRMLSGETALLAVRSGEALHNIPKAIRQLGLDIISLSPQPGGEGVYHLVFRKP